MSALDIKKVAGLFKALSDPTRLRILSVLQEEALCVMDIVTILKIPQPTISRHLAYLQKKGLIHSQRKGLWHFYTPNKQSLVTQPLDSFLKANFHTLPDLKHDQKLAKTLRRKGGCCPKV